MQYEYRSYLRDYGTYYKVSTVKIPVGFSFPPDVIDWFKKSYGCKSTLAAECALELFYSNYELFKKLYTFDNPVGDDFLKQNGRFVSSVLRTKSNLEQLANCNKWDYFVTFTISPEKYDRYDFKAFYKSFSKYVNNFKRKHDFRFYYVFVPEMHADGAWHLHGLIGGLPVSFLKPFDLSQKLPKYIRDKLIAGECIYDFPEFSEKFGYSVVEPLRDKERASNYISKYISKGFFNDDRFKNVHFYYASLGLNRAELICSGSFETSDFKPDYQNDYCTVYKFSKTDFSLDDIKSKFA